MADEQQQQQQDVDVSSPSDETLNTGSQEQEQTQEVDNRIPYDRFKEKVDEANRLKKELAALKEQQEAAERAKLEEQNEYKKLYEQAQEQLAAARTDALNVKKDALLAKAGYTDEQIEKLRHAVTGDTDEAIAQSVEELKAVITPKPDYADPSPMNDVPSRPEPEDGVELGRSLFDKLKAKKKIK